MLLPLLTTTTTTVLLWDVMVVFANDCPRVSMMTLWLSSCVVIVVVTMVIEVETVGMME